MRKLVLAFDAVAALLSSYLTSRADIRHYTMRRMTKRQVLLSSRPASVMVPIIQGVLYIQGLPYALLATFATCHCTKIQEGRVQLGILIIIGAFE